MIAVIIFRWLFGYVRFSVEGRFPERFVNLAARQGLNLWKLTGGGSISACARRRDVPMLFEAAEKTGCLLHIQEEHGLPAVIMRYRHRWGLAAGALVCAVVCHYLSGAVWNITVTVPEQINEYEIRMMLREYGLYEGVRADSVDVPGIINGISTSDRRISWMTVNIMGTNAEVNISPNLSGTENKKSGSGLSNLKSIADGTVTQVKVYKGTAQVKAGDGIRKNQLLVSGLLEYNNGSVVMTEASACVMARTSRRVTLTIPKTVTAAAVTGTVSKKELDFFGLRLPLTLNEDPAGNRYLHTSLYRLCPMGGTIPIGICKEQWRQYENRPVELSQTQAGELLENKLNIYEWFMIGSTDSGRIINRSCKLSEKDGEYVLTADYVIEENVCVRSVVNTEQETQ